MNTVERDVVTACLNLSRRLGLGPDVAPVVIGRFSNLALWLAPTPWVARVATGTAGPRAGLEWARREVGLTRALAQAGLGVPVPAPGELAGPHVEAGRRITLWQRLLLDDVTPDPRAAGQALAGCHRVLARLPIRLDGGIGPAWAPLAEARRLLDHPTVRERAGADAQWVTTRLDRLTDRARQHPGPAQWLHGDAHLNNVRALGEGTPVWLDWEDTCRAPLEWDLAGLVGAARVLGRPGNPEATWAEAALAGWREHGPAVDETLLDLCVELRALFVVAWSWWLGRAGPTSQARLDARLAWLRARQDA